LSVDDELHQEGLLSGINWQVEFERYLSWLIDGLAKRKKAVFEIFRLWDKEFFPASETSLGGKQKENVDAAEAGHKEAMEALNAGDEELDEQPE
jgi:hypothetical protein